MGEPAILPTRHPMSTRIFELFRPPFHVCDSIFALPPAYDRISAYSMASVGEKGRKSPGGPGGGEGRTREGAKEHLEGVEEPESLWGRSRRRRLRIFFVSWLLWACCVRLPPFIAAATRSSLLLRLTEARCYLDLAATWSTLLSDARCYLDLAAKRLLPTI